MKIAILYGRVLDLNGEQLTVGGIQTYILQLVHLFSRLGHEVAVFQISHVPFLKNIESICFHGVGHFDVFQKGPAMGSVLLQAAEEWLGDPDNAIVLFAQDEIAVRSERFRSILIQHGIYWDLPESTEVNMPWSIQAPDQHISRKSKFRRWVKSRLPHQAMSVMSQVSRIRDLDNHAAHFDTCNYRVCVDYNFLNWYRTIHSEPANSHTWAVLNSVAIADPNIVMNRNYSPEYVNILFARRFYWYRGVGIAALAARTLLETRSNVRFTFAGEGEEEVMLRKYFADDSRVTITKYAPSELESCLLNHDISITPSLGSEGTSFSVGEALGCGCAVVATAVGGITNMIVSGYNGLLISPTTKSLSEALCFLVDDNSYRKKIAINGYETARNALSISVWEDKWTEIINEVSRAPLAQ